MTFREALDRKMAIDRMARLTVTALGISGKRGKIDKDIMRELVGIAGYERTDARRMELYQMPDADGQDRVLVLDNELAIYRTSPRDVALRRAPRVKEMVSLINIKKILYDSDVVVSKYADSVVAVHTDCLATLDLTYTDADIAALADEGRTAVMTLDTKGMIAAVGAFAELLDINSPSPRPIQGRIWLGGRPDAPWAVVLDRVTPKLSLIKDADSPSAAVKRAQSIINNEDEVDTEGTDVFDHLAERILRDRPSVRMIKFNPADR